MNIRVEKPKASDLPREGFWLCRDCGLLQPDSWSKGCDGCGAMQMRLRWMPRATMNAGQLRKWLKAKGVEL